MNSAMDHQDVIRDLLAVESSGAQVAGLRESPGSVGQGGRHETGRKEVMVGATAKVQPGPGRLAASHGLRFPCRPARAETSAS